MRMNLTEEEAKAILRMREVEDAHRAGWNKALERVEAMIDQEDSDGGSTYASVYQLREAIKGAKR